MKKLMFVIIVLVFLSTTFLLADSNTTTQGKIIEKGTQRYFKLGEYEYICNSDNRISESSAKEILKLVHRIYERQSNSKEDEDTIQALWESLHKVCSGEEYDEILFICLKYKLNKLCGLLKGRETEKEDIDDYNRQIKTKTKTLIGDLLYVEWYAATRGEGADLLIGDVLNKCWWPTTFVTGNIFVMSDGFIEGMGTDYIEIKKNATDYGSKYTKNKKNEMIQSSISTFNDCLSDSSRDWVKKYLVRASNVLYTKIETLLIYYIEHANKNSVVYDSEWDKLMIRLPKLAIVLPKGKDGKAIYHEEAVKTLAARILELSLVYSKSDKNKEELIIFGKNNSLQFKTTTSDDKKQKPLF